MKNFSKHRVLDSWALVKGDAEKRHVERCKAQMRDNWAHLPNVEVRSFKRNVKAGGAVIEVVAVVARQRIVEG